MQCLITILMYLGLITSPTGYSDADLNTLATQNKDAITNYAASCSNNQNADATTTVTINKTVWDHEQL